MNDEMPGTGRLTPRGSGATGSAALGSLTDRWARDTFLRVDSDRPPTSPIAAAAALTPAATMNCRRAGGPLPSGCATGGRAIGGPARNGPVGPAQESLSQVPPVPDPAGTPGPAATQPTLSSSSSLSSSAAPAEPATQPEPS